MTELEFGAQLKRLRQAKHLTQQELADQLSVSNKSVSRWESGGYPDVTTLAPLAKALGVSVDELLGCQPPLRAFGRSDWQNLMSYAFALGGGVVFYLLDLFMPSLICYLIYLTMMAYGIHLQRHYTYHSHWFYGANALMDFFINLQLTSLVVGSVQMLSSTQNLALVVNTMLEIVGAREWGHLGEYIPRLLVHALPWLLLSSALSTITQAIIWRTTPATADVPRLKLHQATMHPAKLPPLLSPVLLAVFWWPYHTEDTRYMWAYDNQSLLYLLSWLMLTGLVILYLLLLHRRGMLFPACLMQAGCLLYPVLAGKSRAYSTVSDRFIKYSHALTEGTYSAFGQFNSRILAVTVVLILLYLLCCAIKIEKTPG